MMGIETAGSFTGVIYTRILLTLYNNDSAALALFRMVFQKCQPFRRGHALFGKLFYFTSSFETFQS